MALGLATAAGLPARGVRRAHASHRPTRSPSPRSSTELSGTIVHDTTGYLYNPAHRWHYFRDMRPDEVLVFKAHDTDTRLAGRVPHTAFTDPTCPPGTPTRASVEMRGLAFFD